MKHPLSIEEIRARLSSLDIRAAIAELQAMVDAGEAEGEPVIAFEKDIATFEKRFKEEKGVDAITHLLAEIEKQHTGFLDPGEGNYDFTREDAIRNLAELTSFYDESGPRSDPAGDYLCGTCCLRQEPGACLYVTGHISMSTGSCQIYVRGDALDASFALKDKYTQEEAGYAERPEAKGFGCGRCTYGEKADAPDPDGRKGWCRVWGMHMRRKACCAKHDGPDMVTPSSKDADE